MKDGRAFLNYINRDLQTIGIKIKIKNNRIREIEEEIDASSFRIKGERDNTVKVSN